MEKLGPVLALAAFVALGLLVFPIIKACAAPDSRDGQAIALEILERGGFQRDLQTPQPEKAEEESGFWDCDDDEKTEAPPPPPKTKTVRGEPTTPFQFGPVGEAVLWTLAGVLALLLLFRIGTATLAWHRQRAGPPGPGSNGISSMTRPLTAHEEDAPLDLDEAARLARHGQYTDAIRMLLFYCLQHLESLPGISRSQQGPLTSREILQASPLTGEARISLKTIIAAEEMGHFGGQATSERLYQNCRDAYTRFQQSMLQEGRGTAQSPTTVREAE